MMTQKEVREAIDRALAEDRVEDAEALEPLLLPVSAEEFERNLAEAPYDDEPFTEEDRRAFDRAWAIIRGTNLTEEARQA